MKNTLITIKDTQNILHLVNPAHVVEILPQGELIGNEVVVEISLSNGRSICAIGFGSDDCGACLNAATQLEMIAID